MKLQAGQTLLEVLIALVIIVMVITAFVTLGTVSVRNSVFSKNQSTATQLAQEGVEAMITIRDQNTDGAIDWPSSPTVKKWSQLVGQSIVANCNSDPKQPCNGDFTLTRYTPSGGSEQYKITKTSAPESIAPVFNRKIQITDAGTNLKNVSAVVWWEDSNGLHKSVLTRKIHKDKLE